MRGGVGRGNEPDGRQRYFVLHRRRLSRCAQRHPVRHQRNRTDRNRRGPAGTLFGTNSTGGAINITSGPKGEFGVKQDFSYARFGSFRSKTRIDTPEWNGLSASVSYLHNEKKNNVRNFRQTTIDYSAHTSGEVGKLTSVKRLGENTNDAVHVAVRWKDVVEGLTLDYKYDWSRQKSSPLAVYMLGLPDTGGGIGAAQMIMASGASVGLCPDQARQDRLQRQHHGNGHQDPVAPVRRQLSGERLAFDRTPQAGVRTSVTAAPRTSTASASSISLRVTSAIW